MDCCRVSGIGFEHIQIFNLRFVKLAGLEKPIRSLQETGFLSFGRAADGNSRDQNQSPGREDKFASVFAYKYYDKC